MKGESLARLDESPEIAVEKREGEAGEEVGEEKVDCC